MNNKILLTLASFILIGQMALFAQEEAVATEQSQEKGRKVGIGIEGGWNENFFTTDNTAVGNGAVLVERVPYEHIRGSGRLGLTIMASASKKFDGLMSKYTYENSLGYIFAHPVESGGGIYFHSGFNANFRLGKGNNYFYTGYGFGVEYYQDYQDTAAFTDIQFARVPLGFKLMIDSRAEFFMEANFVFGMGLYGADLSQSGLEAAMLAMGFSFNTDFKAGLRYWF